MALLLLRPRARLYIASGSSLDHVIAARISLSSLVVGVIAEHTMFITAPVDFVTVLSVLLTISIAGAAYAFVHDEPWILQTE